MPIRTIKIPYSCSNSKYWAEYAQLNQEQANIIRFAFNRFQAGLKEKEIRLLLKNLKHITLDTWFQQSAIRAAGALWESTTKRNQSTVVFGKNAFQLYKENKITKQELKEARTFGISSIGEAPQKGNRKFSFVSLNEVQFKIRKGEAFSLEINPSKNQKLYLKAIMDLSKSRTAPISVRLTKTHLHLAFDVSLMRDTKYQAKTNRLMGVDMNPNRFAFCIKNRDNILKSESFDLMPLRIHTKKGYASNSNEKKYLNNKKRHEVLELAHYFIKQAKSLHCEAIALENLSGMRAAQGSKHFNRAVNNDFRRKLFRDVIEKLCAINNIRFIEILPQYTSFMGCVVYGSVLPDPLSAAACICDAGLHTLSQINKGAKWVAWFNALKIDSSLYEKSTYLNQWKKEDLCFESIKELYNSVKQLFGSNESMTSSYHAFSSSCALRAGKFKSDKSQVQRIYVI
jgi:transposase